MSFEVTDQHVVEYHGHGYTILHSLLTPGLLHDLRVAAEPCRQIALRKTEMHGEQVLRPLGNYAAELDLAPFGNYVEHPPFIEAIHQIVGPDARVPAEDVGVLFEPRDAPMCTNWHRDISPPVKKWDAFRRQMTMTNTIPFTLEAGDAVIYASYGLHFAHRAPYRKRATLHHHPRSEMREDWVRQHVLFDQPANS